MSDQSQTEVTVNVADLQALVNRIEELEKAQAAGGPSSAAPVGPGIASPSSPPTTKAWSLTVTGSIDDSEVIKWRQLVTSFGQALHSSVGLSTFDARADTDFVSLPDVELANLKEQALTVPEGS